MSLSFLRVPQQELIPNPTTVATSPICVLKTHPRKGSWVAGHVLSKGTQRQGPQVWVSHKWTPRVFLWLESLVTSLGAEPRVVCFCECVCILCIS